MTIDHSSDFDARRVGWWQRRAAVRRLKGDTSLMPADRDLRVQQAKVAQTRGELNALTRDLGVAPASQAYAAPPQQTYGPVVPPAYTPPAVSSAPPRAQPGKSSGFRPSVLIAVVVVLVTLGTTAVSCVSTVVSSVSDMGFDSGSSFDGNDAPLDDLQTISGWNDMVEVVDGEAGTTDVVGVVVRPDLATISVPDADDTAAVQRYFYDGELVAAEDGVRRASAQVFDLAAVDPATVMNVIVQARVSSGAVDNTTTAAQVAVADNGDGLRFEVTFPDSPQSSYRLVAGADGRRISEQR
ncbi:hypothetical protein [Aeromicrobium stalagmiti]|uniref:hypothetical protein n=1 Tax=Aeromicrobium stalagmiti TaxID=2738988 RepID=UPI0015690D62|nr:hypothetical protein [Aeromicrobium stalagmiti]NRQ50907.1 hypothetical protein [Aeromicrobium stalagmiti]